MRTFVGELLRVLKNAARVPTTQSIQKTVELLEVPPFVDKVADMAVVVKGRRMRYRRAQNPEAHTRCTIDAYDPVC